MVWLRCDICARRLSEILFAFDCETHKRNVCFRPTLTTAFTDGEVERENARSIRRHTNEIVRY